MRRFATVSHTGRSDGDWHLNDLSAKAGRIDLLCRNIQSAFFLSHGLREDVEFYAVFAESALRQKTVRLQGNAIQMLHPDERSTAARLQQALQAAWSVPDWKEVQRGLAVARFGLEGLLDDLKGKCTPVLLDPKGTPIESWEPPKDPLFLLSDHMPFSKAEYAALDAKGVQRVSLGPHWYHGNHAISVVQWFLDKREPPVSSDARNRDSKD
ncbi:MAG TPA: tRNA (pseudouridine(54)-N(1))-methyltransferase TrmY [Candidatus Thermoplasmatota archaeon]|nr:tRNA (pseudouridine(54)-N(1))-methyltransferase TrmY [Candidatus Thermoplasmatota archaeon]